MQQPMNGRLLVEVSAAGEFKHVKLDSDKQHQLAVSSGVVLRVAPDLEHIIRQALKIEPGEWIANLPLPEELVGMTVRWEKYAEQNALFDVPGSDGKKVKVALIEYKDITSYES